MENKYYFFKKMYKDYVVILESNGKYNDLEIDFIAISPEEKIYYQVARSILSEEVKNREKRSLLAIDDNYKKVILTMDNVYNKVIDGIEVENIVDFLLEEK